MASETNLKTFATQIFKHVKKGFPMRSELVDLVYPVGSIYMSMNETDPSTLFGGNWQKIQGKFLLGTSSKYAVGNTGGQETHTLTVAEMPKHNHFTNSFMRGYTNNSQVYGTDRYTTLVTDSHGYPGENADGAKATGTTYCGGAPLITTCRRMSSFICGKELLNTERWCLQ